MIKLLDLLKESLTDTMYHFTYSGKLIDILKDDEIKLGTALGSKADLNVNKGKYNFLSLTRSKSSGYVKGNVKIVLDGNKLNKNYKSIPVDYWQYSKKESDWSSKSGYIQSLKSSEQEDRIISDKTSIENASKYIKAIHYDADEKLTDISVKIINLCKKRGIPLFIYKETQDWLLQKNSIDISKLKLPIENDGESEVKDDRGLNLKMASFVAYNSPDNYQKIIDYLGDKDSIEYFKNELDERTRNNYRIGALYYEDGINAVMAYLHNSRTFTSNSAKFLINLLIKDMRRFNVNNIVDYLKKKQWLGKKTIDDIKKELIKHLDNVSKNEIKEEIDYKNQFSYWIEIDGVYHNKLYETPEIRDLIDGYINKVKSYIYNEIKKSDKHDLHRIYAIESDYIEKAIDLNNIKIDFNVTDVSDGVNLIYDITELIKSFIIYVSAEYREKSGILMKEFYDQLKN